MAERLLRSDITAGSERHIIDMPCGYGRFYPLLKRLGFRVSAMDQSQSMVTICRDQPDFQDGDTAEAANILKTLPGDAEAANQALCVRMFQHLHDSPLRVQALRTLGGNNRRVVMTYYESGCLHYWSKRLLMFLKRKPVRIRMISRSQFASEVAEAGLQIEERIKLFPGFHAQTWVRLRRAD